MKSEIRLVTPEMATAWLAVPTENRPINKNDLAALKAALLCGEFKTTHQGILLGKNNAVIDGQHRLLAIATTGIAALMLVTVDEKLTNARDLPIDLHGKRHLAFILGIGKDEARIGRFVGTILWGHVPSSWEVKPLAERAATGLASLGQLSHQRRFWSVPILTAAATTVLTGSSPVEYVRNQLSALLNNDPKQLSPRAYSFYRQLVGGTKMDAREQLMRALAAFDEATSGRIKIQIKNEEVRWDSVVRLLQTAFLFKAA